MVACETCFNPAEAMPTATTCFVQLRRGSHDSHACQTLLDLLICLFFPETASTATPTFKVEEFAGKPAGGGAGTNHKPGSMCGRIQAEVHRFFKGRQGVS